MFKGVSFSNPLTAFLGCVGAIFLFGIVPMIANGEDVDENGPDSEKAISAPYGGSEASHAAMVQIQNALLKMAGLPTDISQIIGRKFAFYYGAYGTVIGTINGLELLDDHNVVLYISVPYIDGVAIDCLFFKTREPEQDHFLTGRAADDIENWRAVRLNRQADNSVKIIGDINGDLLLL